MVRAKEVLAHRKVPVVPVVRQTEEQLVLAAPLPSAEPVVQVQPLVAVEVAVVTTVAEVVAQT
jgi:hypothetical protein